jgi:hypothetical protein
VPTQASMAELGLKNVESPRREDGHTAKLKRKRSEMDVQAAPESGSQSRSTDDMRRGRHPTQTDQFQTKDHLIKVSSSCKSDCYGRQ